MKQIKNIFLLVLFTTFITSCEDAYEIDQVGRLDQGNAFRSVDDLQLGLLGVYNEFDLTPEISLSANFTDEIAVGFDSGGQGFALYDFILNEGSAAAFNFWTRNFRVNNRATIVLEAAKLIEPEAGEQDTYNNILAQLYFIRAYANLEMLIYFSPDPRDDSTLSVPVIDFVAPTDIQPLRNTTGEHWEFINSDVQQSLSLSTEQSNPTFASIDAINALRARIALTRGDFAQAETLAMDLLNSYGLADRTQYDNMFKDTDNTEIIFKLDRTLNDDYDGQVNTGSVNTGGGWVGSIFAFVSATLDGSPYFEMDRSVFDLLDPADIRFDVNVGETSVISPDYENDPDPINNDKLVINKYFGNERPLLNDIKVFRSAEMLLIAAEAKALKPSADLAGAAALIDQLRDARFGSDQAAPSYANAQEAVGDILDERKIELCYEGHRFKDLKRAGIVGNRMVNRDPIACELQSGACTLSPDDFRFTLPIPIVEINANPEIATQQNPGY